MIRAFVALPLPEEVTEALLRLERQLPLPRPLTAERMHITLAFLGELPEPQLEEAHLALSALRMPGFDLVLQGVDVFGGAKPHVVYAALRAEPLLMALQARVVTALRRAGAPPEARRFVPHVTLARLRPGRGDPLRLANAVIGAADFRAGPWRATQMILYRSDPGEGGRTYIPLAAYPLLG